MAHLVLLVALASLVGCGLEAPIGVLIDDRMAQSYDECGNGMDDDADGQIDERCPCGNGESQRCFSGTYPHRLIGACVDGTQRCDVRGSQEFHFWGSCDGDQVPITERCDGAIDEDCDGAIDEGCSCDASEQRPCAEDFSIAPCAPGVQRCQDDGLFSGCEGAIGPSAELCGDEIDNDCDGDLNEGCECLPEPERCGDEVDNDCDGTVDEPACLPPLNDGGIGGCDCQVGALSELLPVFTSEGDGPHIVAQAMHAGLTHEFSQVLRPGLAQTDNVFRRVLLGVSMASEAVPHPGTALPELSSTHANLALKSGARGHYLLRRVGLLGGDLELWDFDLSGDLSLGGEPRGRHIAATHSSGSTILGESALITEAGDGLMAWGVCLQASGGVGTQCLRARDVYRRFRRSSLSFDPPVILSERTDSESAGYTSNTYLMSTSTGALVMHLRTYALNASLDAGLRVFTTALDSEGATLAEFEHPNLGLSAPGRLGNVHGRLASNGTDGALACVYVRERANIVCVLLDHSGRDVGPGPIVLNYAEGLPAGARLWEDFELSWDACSYLVTLLVRLEGTGDRLPMVWRIDPSTGVATELYRAEPGPWIGQDLLGFSPSHVARIWLRERNGVGETHQDRIDIDCAPTP